MLEIAWVTIFILSNLKNYNIMEWTHLTFNTFKQMYDAYLNHKTVLITHPAFYEWKYEFYNGDKLMLEIMIKSNNYYYIILDEPK